ncbi:MAG: pyridoxal phosphate-dependent aminotransferase [Spirochaetales bacterium]|nr:pyridoxal phosphate-dependent aminotransferase [Spirochaetales bacterium]MBQ2259300.1 pyridoxal phosphate-dependent aminotransferase [Spirochaetales bacterium]
MKMSNRISGFQTSPIRRLVPFSREAEKKGTKVIHLNIGQPDIQTPREAIEAIQNYDRKIIEYGISEGDVELRRAMLNYYSKFGIKDISEDNIMITTGGSEALQFVFLTLCDPYDEFIIPEPYYTNVATFANVAMVKLKPVTSSSSNGFILPSIDAFEDKINKKTMGILLCSPNNPTGHIYTTEELEALLALCEKHDIFLVVDEVYREFCYDGKTFTSVLNFEKYQDRIICIDSFSKRFSMCGARVGAIVTKNMEFLENAMKMAQARLCPPNVEQVAAAAALNAPDEYIEGVVAEYERRRNVLVGALQKIEGVRINMPKGAFYFIADLPVDDAEKFALFMLRDFSYKGATVMFAPAEDFYWSSGLGKSQARFAYVLNEEDLLLAAECIKEGLKVYRKKVMHL